MLRPRQAALLWAAFVIVVAVALTVAAPLRAAPYAAMVIDARSGEVLHSRNADTRLHPASLTKMMTLYVVFDAVERGEIGLDDYVTVSHNAAAEPPSKLYLKPGQRIRLRYLIRASSVKSANDAATAMAEAISGSEAAFARRMTNTARALGMTNTTFRNAHGLTERGHLSTARDMTKMGRALFYHFPDYYNLFSRRTANAAGKTVYNTNRKLLAYGYPVKKLSWHLNLMGFFHPLNLIYNFTWLVFLLMQIRHMMYIPVVLTVVLLNYAIIYSIKHRFLRIVEKRFKIIVFSALFLVFGSIQAIAIISRRFELIVSQYLPGVATLNDYLFYSPGGLLQYAASGDYNLAVASAIYAFSALLVFLIFRDHFFKTREGLLQPTFEKTVYKKNRLWHFLRKWLGLHAGKGRIAPGYAADIASSARHLSQVINDVLDVAKLEAGKSLDYKLHKPTDGVYLFVLEGELKVGEKTLQKRDAIGMWELDNFYVEASEDAEILLMEVPMDY